MWYFARLVWLVIPWDQKDRENPLVITLTECFLLEARSIDSAFKKADRILEIKENESGTGEMEGQKVALRRGGVLELEPIIVPLVSGADIFDETESGVRADEIQARVITKDRRRSMVDYEKKNGFPPVLDVFLGDDFDTL